jgi:tetratricopeptide (TPR) repeat protein
LSTKRDRAHFRHIATLIASAADALEYAHSMGVVHRDIKPGNLMLDFSPSPLVGEGRGGGSHLWITDFGLAKLANPAREGGGEITLTGDLIGTLRYMSPEQALAKHGLVDHRTDIYSLGATLYELLTLKPAVAGNDKAEILKAIAWDEPTPLRKHDKLIPAELETITLKCLAKVPGERYATAGEVAEDLRRWLGDRAIMARPPTMLDRAGRWVSRHRAMVALSLTFSLLAMAGLSAGVFLLAKKEKQVTDAYEGEKNQRRLAQVNLELALQALDETSWEAVQSLLPRSSQLKPDEIKRIERLLSFYERFAQENGDQPVVRAETFQAHMRAGELLLTLGNRDRAEQEFRKGQAMAESLAVDRPDDLKAVRNHYFALSNLGRSLVAVGKAADGEQFLLRAADGIDSYRKQFDADFNMIGWQRITRAKLAAICQESKRFDDAELHYQRSIEHADELANLQPGNAVAHAHSGSSRSNLAAILVERGQHDRAESLLQKAIECQNEAIRLDPDSSTWREFLATHHFVLSRIAKARKQPAEHIEALREHIKILEYLAAKFPAEAKYRAKLNWPCYDLGVLLNQIGQQADAMSYWTKVAEGSQQYPHACRARAWVRLTATDEKLRDPAEALRLTMWGSEKFPDSGDWLTLLAFAQHRTGDSRGALTTLNRARKASGEGENDVEFLHAMILHRLGEPDRARERCGAAITVMDRDKKGDDPILRVFRAETLRELGLTEADFEKPTDKKDKDH